MRIESIAISAQNLEAHADLRLFNGPTIREQWERKPEGAAVVMCFYGVYDHDSICRQPNVRVTETDHSSIAQTDGVIGLVGVAPSGPTGPIRFIDTAPSGDWDLGENDFTIECNMPLTPATVGDTMDRWIAQVSQPAFVGPPAPTLEEEFFNRGRERLNET